MLKRVLTLLVLSCYCSFLSAQQAPPETSEQKDLQALYALHNQQYFWIGKAERIGALTKMLDSAALLGLDPAAYQSPVLQLYSNGALKLQAGTDSMAIDQQLSTLLLRFLSHLRNGNAAPALGYRGMKFQPSTEDLPAMIYQRMQEDRLPLLLQELQPRTIEYKALLQKLQWIRAIMDGPGFSEPKVVSREVKHTNKPLVTRLYQLGIFASDSQKISDVALKQSVKEAESMFELLRDGQLRSTLVTALNVPLRYRLAELQQALNVLRWISGARERGAQAVVNIPSANLFVYEKDSLLLYSRVVVGKAATPTPTLSSTISEVIAYPYWHVPKSIATKELLPSIKKNPGFLEANNFQVLNAQGKVVDPYSINWAALGKNYFPYTIRQSTGCDNSLGVLKFNFYNPYTVYLHDTPAKGLFALNKRYFSHGCMRVEKPVELAGLLVPSQNDLIDSLVGFCRIDQKPVVLPVEKSLPLVVVYNTAWYSAEGHVRFYEDIYQKNLFRNE